MYNSAETADVSLAGSVFGQTDVAGMKDLNGSPATAYLHLHFAGKSDRKLIGDARMPVHGTILPAQQPESADGVWGATLIQRLGKQFGEFGEISPVVLAFVDPFELRCAPRRTRHERTGLLQLSARAGPVCGNADLYQPTLVASLYRDR